MDVPSDDNLLGILRYTDVREGTCANHTTPKNQKVLEAWKYPSLPPANNFKATWSLKKLTAIIVWHCKHNTSCGCLDSGLGVTAERYCGTLERPLQAVLIKKKRPWFVRQDNGILHNAGPRMANGTYDTLWRLSGRLWTTPFTAPNTRQVIYSSLVRLLKQMAKKWLKTDVNVKQAVTLCLQKLDIDFFYAMT